MTGTLVALLPRGESVSLGCDDARRLVDALWGVSATRGAVVAIGKIEHGLTKVGAGSPVEMSELEVGAIGAALDAERELSPALTRLRDLTGSPHRR